MSETEGLTERRWTTDTLDEGTSQRERWRLGFRDDARGFVEVEHSSFLVVLALVVYWRLRGMTRRGL